MLGDVWRVAMAHAIAQSLPGAPVPRYGEEIGMSADLSLPDRAAVRNRCSGRVPRTQGSARHSCPRSAEFHSEAGAFEQPSVFVVLHHRAEDAVLVLADLSAGGLQVSLPYGVKADLLADSEYEPATRDYVRLTGYGGYRSLPVRDVKRVPNLTTRMASSSCLCGDVDRSRWDRSLEIQSLANRAGCGEHPIREMSGLDTVRVCH